MSEPAEAPWLSPQLLGLTALLLESHQRLFQDRKSTRLNSSH